MLVLGLMVAPTVAFSPSAGSGRLGSLSLRCAGTTLESACVRPRRCSVGARMMAGDVGTSEQVQDVGRGTLMAGGLGGEDAVKKVSGKVEGLYDAYPYPPEAVFDGVTVGYNHRWSWTHAYSAIHGEAPKSNAIDMLDAGCGTGVTAQYLSHLNPRATHFDALDLSSGALKVAKERAERADLVGKPNNANFHHMSLYDVADLDRKYDFVNCVGVLHHLPDPNRGLRALAERMKEGALMHIFVYSALGRREIMLMQEALALLQGEGGYDDFKEGVRLGRAVFEALPNNTRVKQRENERWAMENARDSTFADMYLHPQEVDYTVETLLQWTDTVKDLGIEFAGFSNPKVWDLERLLGKDPDVLAKAKALPERQQWRLAEILDPDTFTHYEFFLTKGKVTKKDWNTASESEIHAAFGIRQAGLQPWPSDRVFDEAFNLIQFTDAEYELLQKCAQDPTVETTEWGDIEEPRKLSEMISEMENKPTKDEILRMVNFEFLFLRSA